MGKDTEETAVAASTTKPGTPVPATAQSEAIHRAVERWKEDHLRNTDFSRDTGAWNVLQTALPLLGRYLEEEMK